MKHLLMTFLGLLQIGTSFAQDPDRSEAPYISAKTEEGIAIVVPLQSTSAEVNIAGIIADVASHQVYFNSAEVPVSAQYVFPGSTKAAVYSMTMRVGERTIHAKIKEKQEAQEQYDAAVQQGKTASLLQQHRPNVFQMDIGNIPPKTRVEITLHYTELLQPRDGVYEFVYPTIVGQRYDQEIEGSEPWTLNPFANLDQNPPKALPDFDIKVHLQTPIPIHGLNTETHEVDVNYLSKKEATIALNNGEQTENKDFILKYRLRGDKMETGLMLWEGEDENFFLYLGESPERIITEEIPPREYFIIVDVSGSMNGFPLDISKALMNELLQDMRPQDRFNVLLFSASSEILFPVPQPATSANIQQANAFLHAQNGAGGTHLLAALKTAFAHVQESAATSFVILTDGFVTVERQAFDFISSNLSSASFYPIGIGSSVNRHLIEGLAHVSQSEPFFVTKASQGSQIASTFKKYISSPVLTNVKVDIEGFSTYDVIPTNIPDLLGERPVTVFGKWKGEPKGHIMLSGKNAKGTYETKTKVKKGQINPKNNALKYLWARKKLQLLSDYNSLGHTQENRTAITDIGLKYSLLSEFTSFLAVDENQQALEDSHDTPINPGAVPEPHEWALIGLTAIFILIVLMKSRLFS